MRVLLIAVVAAVALVCMGSQRAYAHSPEDIQIRYDAAREEVIVVVTHQVADPRKHYVEKLVLFLNGEPVREETYMSQESAVSQTAILGLKDVKPGDELGVEASCNRRGSMRVSVVVE